MVQFFDVQPTPTAGARLGEALGQGLQQGLSQASNQQYQRQISEQALNEAQRNALAAQGDPVKLAFALAKAGAASPYLERAIGPLYAELIKKVGRDALPNAMNTASNIANQYSNAPGVQNAPPAQPQSGVSISQNNANQPPPNQPVQAPVPRKTAPEIDKYSNEYLQQLRPDLVNQGSEFGRVPTFDFAQKSTLLPQEEAKIRNDLNAKNVPLEIQDRVIENMNNNIQSRYKEALDKFHISESQIAANQKRWEAIQKAAPEKLAPFLSLIHDSDGNPLPKTHDLLTSKYFQYAASQPVNLTDEAIHSNAIALLNRDINQFTALETLPSMPPIRQASDYASYVKSTQDAYKPLRDQGFGEALVEDAMLNKDAGVEEAHTLVYGDLMNPESAKRIGDLKAPTHGYITPGSNTEKAFNKANDAYVKNLTKELSRISPDDDLLILRGLVLDNGGTIQDFTTALQSAQKQYGLKLSPFQSSQLQEIQIPRERPLWEFFSEPINATKAKINYWRGKR